MLPSHLNNTIIKIEDNCAISNAGGASSSGSSSGHNHLLPTDHLSSFTSAGGPNDLLTGLGTSGGFLMPHTPMLTPAPSMFDMHDKPFLSNIAQQQRHFQFNLNTSMKNEGGASSLSSGDTSMMSHAPDLSCLMYSPHFNAHPSLPPVPPVNSMYNSLSQLDTNSLGMMGHANNQPQHHPTIMLTPPSVIAARTTGGLLTPPSPMPEKAREVKLCPRPPSSQVQLQQPPSEISAVPSQVSSIQLHDVGVGTGGGNSNGGGSLLALCSMDMLSGHNNNNNINSGGRVNNNTSATNVIEEQHQQVVRTSDVCDAVVRGGVQDATMQTDTPVCSDEENTQDTAISEENTQQSAMEEQQQNQQQVNEVTRETNTVNETIPLGQSAELCHNSVVGRVETPVQSMTVPEASVQVPEPTEAKSTGPQVDLSGLELLSNSIEAFETIKREAVPKDKGAEPESANENAVYVERQQSPPPPSIRPNEQFDGLNLLCALAEQRLVEEEGVGELQQQQQQPAAASFVSQDQPAMENAEGEVTTKASSDSDFENSPVEKLSDLERNIKQRLADLTRQCEEKRRELDKMEKINPFYRMGYVQSYPVPNKFAMSDDEETRSSRSASVRTPLTPTLLFGINSNGQNTSANNAGGAAQTEVPKVSSDTESSRYDDELGGLEKGSKRKGGQPKRWDDCSETETIVAKKPKPSGFAFQSNKKWNENENAISKGMSKSATSIIKHGHLKSQYMASPSSGSTSSEQQIKFEPMKIKEEILDDDGIIPVENLFSGGPSSKSNEERKHKKKNKTKKKSHKDSEAKKSKKRSGADNRCKLTDAHLDDKEKKTRVLTSMGGLFYAGVLSPIQPPDIYSVVLDGERGNRPHIMSREEVQRDAVLEIIPTSPSEVPPGTRLCAYWSQQYRCLYPGTAAQPGTPDANPKKQYISVEFDDGDSGRIAMGDIRLLFQDYPIVGK